MEDRFRKTLKITAARIKILKGMRQLLTIRAAESIYQAVVLLKLLYCSTELLKNSEILGKRFEGLEKGAIKIIYRCPECEQERRFMTISTQQKFTADFFYF